MRSQPFFFFLIQSCRSPDGARRGGGRGGGGMGVGECLGHKRKPRERRPVKTRAPPSWLLSMSITNELSTKPF